MLQIPVKTNLLLAALPSNDNRVIFAQQINACEAKRSPLVKILWQNTQELYINLGLMTQVEQNDVKKIILGLMPISQNAAFMANIGEVKLYGNAVVLRIEPYPKFFSIHKKMNQQLQSYTEQQYQFETKKKYDPHITIGRIKNLPALNMQHKQQLLSLINEQLGGRSLLIQQTALLQKSVDDSSTGYHIIHLYSLTGKS